jgi:hypothetical protein
MRGEGVSLPFVDNSNKAIEINYGFSVVDGSEKQVAYNRSSRSRNFGPVGDNYGISFWQ